MIGWTSSVFFIATDDGPFERIGLVKNGLGLDSRGVFEGEPVWSLSHLNTGLRLVTLHGDLSDVLPPADEIACAADWSFDDLRKGKDNSAFVGAIIAASERYPGRVHKADGPIGDHAAVSLVQQAGRRH